MSKPDVQLGTKEIRDLTRIERIGAHSHIRGIYYFYQFYYFSNKFVSFLFKCNAFYYHYYLRSWS